MRRGNRILDATPVVQNQAEPAGTAGIVWVILLSNTVDIAILADGITCGYIVVYNNTCYKRGP